MPRPVEDERVLVEVPSWAAELFHPAGRAAVILAVAAVSGFGAVAYAWWEVAATLFVPFQVPWLISAGIAGVAVTVTSLALLGVHLERRAAAEHRADVDDLTRAVLTMADELATWAATPRRPKRARKAPARRSAAKSV